MAAWLGWTPAELANRFRAYAVLRGRSALHGFLLSVRYLRQTIGSGNAAEEGARSGIDSHQMKARSTAWWAGEDNGKSFATALAGAKGGRASSQRRSAEPHDARHRTNWPRSSPGSSGAQGRPGRSTRKASLECRDGGKPS
jgi:hypothetical protein